MSQRILCDCLPWLLGVAVLVLLALIVRRLSVAYSDGVIKKLESLTGAAPPVVTPPLDLSSGGGALEEHKKAIRKIMRDHPLEPVAQIEALVGFWADTQLTLRFERLYVAIYGSQLQFLRALNRQTNTTREDARQFYEVLATGNKSVSLTPFDTWVQFLWENGLLTGNAQSLTITPVGRDFLVWLVTRGLNDKTNERA